MKPATCGGVAVDFRVDYLTTTVRTDQIDVIGASVVNLFCVGSLDGLRPCGVDNWRDTAQMQVHGNRGYETIYLLPLGIRLYAEPRNASHGDHMSIEIKGEALAAAGMQAVKDWFTFLADRFPPSLPLRSKADLGWYLTRLDLAFDGVPFTPRMAFDAALRDDVRTWAKRESLAWHDTPLDPEQGSTCTLGARSSERFLRIYDKRGPTRLELELKKDRASNVGFRLAELPLNQWAGESLTHVRDYIDFVDHSTDSNARRCPLLPWWSAFVGQAEKAGMTLGRQVVQTLERTWSWVERQVAKSLAVLHIAEGGDQTRFLEMIEKAGRCLGPRHRSLLATSGNL
jgi:DNA relaxase NicK